MVKRIVRYIAGTIHLGLRYKKGRSSDLSLLGYIDSDHSGDLVHRKSTSGVVFYLGSSLVTWASQKHKVVTLSTCEAEYVAAVAGSMSGCLAQYVGGRSDRQ